MKNSPYGIIIIVNFIYKNMKTWRVELTAREKNGLAEAKIQRGIFQGDGLILLIIATMPLNHILRKSTTGYRLSRSQRKINHLIYDKNEKELETLIHAVRIYSHDIGMECGIEKCAMLVMKSSKRHLIAEWNYQAKRRKNSRRKGNLQILGHFEGWHH